MAVNGSSATPPCLARAPGKSSGATPDSVAQRVADAESSTSSERQAAS
jgi:hypothetical protein